MEGSARKLAYFMSLPDTHILQEQSPAHHTNISPSRSHRGQ